MDNNDIGKVFKEKLNNLNESPPSHIWDNIVLELNQKRKKKIIFPFWQRASVVAIILIVFSILTFKSNNEKNIIITKKNSEIKTPLKQKKSIYIENKVINNTKTKQQIVITTNQNLTNNTKTALSNPSFLQINRYNINKPDINYFKNIKNLNKELYNFNTRKNRAKINYIEFMFADLPNYKHKEDLKIKSIPKIEDIWSISLLASPIYNKSIINNYSIDPTLAQNEINNEIASSYGLKVSIPIFDNIKIRTGLNLLSFKTITKDVSYSSLLFTSNILYETGMTNSLNVNLDPSNKVDIIHKINYFEIPIEFSINIINKKIELNAITGISTLLLYNNNLYINSVEIGSVNNLNNLSYSGNLGFNSIYKINKKINFSVEPIAKLRLKSYKNTNNISYFLGVYSGITYKF